MGGFKPLQLTEGKIKDVYTCGGPVGYVPVYNQGVVLIHVDLVDLSEVMVDIEVDGKVETIYGEVYDNFVSLYKGKG